MNQESAGKELEKYSIPYFNETEIKTMTQEQEKAKELVEKFHYQICNDNGLSENESSIFCSKQCAIIHCKDIIENFGLLSDGKQFFTAYATIQFYQQVLTEIEKL